MPFTIETAAEALKKVKPRLENLLSASAGEGALFDFDEEIADIDNSLADLRSRIHELKIQREHACSGRSAIADILDEMDEDEIAAEYEALVDEERRLTNWIKDQEKAAAKSNVAA